MIISLLIIHNYDRSSESISRVLHMATWDYFALRLPDFFRRSPKVLNEAIMTEINDLVQEFWRTSSDGSIGASLFEMHRLFGILQKCIAEVCFDIVFVFLRLQLIKIYSPITFSIPPCRTFKSTTELESN